MLEEHDALGGDKRPDLAYYIEMVDQWAARKGSVTIRPGDDPAKLDPIRKAMRREPPVRPTTDFRNADPAA